MTSNPKELVRQFLTEVRSGKNPGAAGTFMAPTVRANQVVSETTQLIERTPQEYAEHVREMLAEYGNFQFEIDELISENEKVYARWTQIGNGVRQVTSCVYRVEQNKIVEYWIQIDRLGLQLQQHSWS
ncbi:MAG: ester cyclase [Actinomycetales bacterium]|nr:ester cyclase [Actinomycetales bacterium]